MNEQVQEYLSKKRAEEEKNLERNKIRLLTKLKLGTYEEMPKGADPEDYPMREYHEVQQKYYRYRYYIENLSDEEYQEILKYYKQDIDQQSIKDSEEIKINGWYTFAIIWLILWGLVLLIGFGADELIAVYIGASGFVSGLIWCPIVIMLCKIEKNQRLDKQYYTSVIDEILSKLDDKQNK